MTPFYYYSQNPSGVCSCISIRPTGSPKKGVIRKNIPRYYTLNSNMCITLVVDIYYIQQLVLQYWSIITLVGDTVSIELEEDGSLALSSLKALCANATGLCFTSENGRRRSVRVLDNKCFPPQRKWGERVYEVLVPANQMSTNLLLLLLELLNY